MKLQYESIVVPETISEEQKQLNLKAIRPIVFDEDDRKNSLYGSKWKTNEGYTVKIIKYEAWDRVYVEFIDTEFKCIVMTGYSLLKNGKIKYPYKRNKYGAFFGQGPYSSINEMHKVYDVWKDIFRRIEKFKFTAYKNCSVDLRWYNYQNFADWYLKTISVLNPAYIYELDKDILQWNYKYKVYGPDTCCLVPHDINICLSNLYVGNTTGLPLGVRYEHGGNKYQAIVNLPDKPMTYLGVYNTPEEAFLAYKKEKEKIIRYYADLFYNNNAITKKVYDALYTIDIKPFNNQEII